MEKKKQSTVNIGGIPGDPCPPEPTPEEKKRILAALPLARIDENGILYLDRIHGLRKQACPYRSTSAVPVNEFCGDTCPHFNVDITSDLPGGFILTLCQGTKRIYRLEISTLPPVGIEERVGPSVNKEAGVEEEISHKMDE